MAMIKTLKFVNGIPKEINPEVDSIFAKSIKVGGAAGTELTKEILDSLSGTGDASSLHNHDTQYYTKSQVDSAIADAQNSGGGAVAAEEAARIAADEALQGQIDTNASAIATKASQAALDQEISDRQAADASTLQAAKDYSDAAEQRIMGGIAPETLDTIAEIAAALQSEETATGAIMTQLADHETRIDAIETELPNKASQAALSQEVSDRQAADSALQTSIDQVASDLSSEASARQGADAALESRISAIENDGSSSAALAQEVQDRQDADALLQTAINNEASTRQSADNALQASIDSESSARSTAITNLTNSLNNEISRATAAESAEADARQVGDTILEDAIAAEEARATAAEASLQSAISAEESARQSADTTLTNNLASEVSRAQAEEATFLKLDGSRQMTGDLNMNVKKITNLAPAVSGSDAVTKAQLDAAVSTASSGSSDALDQEIADRQAADANLQSQITAVTTSLAWKGGVFAVTADARMVNVAHGTSLQSILPFSDDEGTQLTEADFSVGMRILVSAGASSRMLQVVTEEGLLSFGAPTEDLASGHAFVVKNDLIDSPAAQEGRAIYHFDGSSLQKIGDFDWSLASGIDISSAFSDADAAGFIVSGDSIEEALQKLQRRIKSDYQDMQDSVQAVSTDLSDEVTRAQAAEALLQDNIDAEATRAQAAEQANANAIATEVSDREAAVLAESTARQSADANLQSQITSNATAISDEVSNRIAADSLLDGRIDDEITDREAADSALDARITAIENDGSSAAALQSEIDRATAAEAALDSKIDQEISDRQAADQVNSDAISAEASARASAISALQATDLLKVNKNINDYLAGEALSDGELVVLKYDAATTSIRAYKASSASADNADWNNGSWAIAGAVQGSVAMGTTVSIKKAIGDFHYVSFDVATTSADVNKAVYLSADGKATLSAPTDSGSGIVYLGVCVGPSGHMILCPAVLRGVLD